MEKISAEQIRINPKFITAGCKLILQSLVDSSWRGESAFEVVKQRLEAFVETADPQDVKMILYLFS